MRKLEKQMNSAIRNRQAWAGSNTQVVISDSELSASVYLHGNLIASVDMNNYLTLFDGGFQSNTTKSRLNALCEEFATGRKVIQKNWTWFVRLFDGSTLPFYSGITIGY